MPDRDNPQAAELAHLLELRRAEGADRAAVEAAIHRRFGRRRTVLFTDLVGFSRAVEAFGIVHFLQLIYESEKLFLPRIDRHGGRVLKREGDSLLALFETPVEALACAEALHGACREHNRGAGEAERLEVCIGLGDGEVLCIGDHEVWGAEVNAAAKLGEDIARGGETLVTESVRAAGAAGGYRFHDHGQLFGRPVFRVAADD